MNTDPSEQVFISLITPGQDTLNWKVFLGRSTSVPGLYALGIDRAGVTTIETIITVVAGPVETISNYSLYPVVIAGVVIALLGAGAAYAYKKIKWG